MSTETDEQGRLYFPKELREKYGRKYHIVTYEDKLELIPVAEEPLVAVREAAGELREEPIEEIRAAVKAEATDEVGHTQGDG